MTFISYFGTPAQPHSQSLSLPPLAEERELAVTSCEHNGTFFRVAFFYFEETKLEAFSFHFAACRNRYF